MRGFAIIIGFDGLGWLLHTLAGVPLPSHVLGLLLLAAALFLNIVRVEWVEGCAALLTGHFMLFFVPLLVGAIAFLPLIGDSWLAAAVSVTAGTAAIMLATGFAAERLMSRGREKGHEQQRSLF
ncbi:CidA/LrgA family protein [Paenibacillus oenotherae]|uniref:CidA/LrgA family protein n=1 Tax=Paenibacillus oenotherae TaxID=1435645 RepID=A0ABS7D1A3_9BACL|nr:CidA/LrgA family protein [Paenibacillus oenotherae]MBW7473352.1 CidA/LrgA family protein [Paenibacillus oenotherae]